MNLPLRVVGTPRNGWVLSLSVAVILTGVHALDWLVSGSWGTSIIGEPSRTSAWTSLAAAAVMNGLLAVALTTYLRNFGDNRLRLLRSQVGIWAMLILSALVAKILLWSTTLPALWLPVALVPLWMGACFERRAGFWVALTMAFLLGAMVRMDALIVCVLLARGMAATLLWTDRRTNGRLLMAGLCAGVFAGVVLLVVRGLTGAPVLLEADWSQPADSLLIAAVGGGLVEGIVAVFLRPVAERVLGRVSRERLLRLTDLEQPLLKRLASEAPGTFEHSRAMANLAEQAASAIGADALLTRVGAYYHDLGKTIESKHFVENLHPGEPSPHDSLAPEESARRIVNHVVEGTRILREGGIPEPVVEFAYTHHGTQVIEYFLNKYKQQGSTELDESHFRYPGMKPQTKETAILMLVDSIEAASRTIDPPERQRFEQMVQRIVQTKLEQGQLDDCRLSLRELRIIQDRMVATLVHMNHHRIKYPWQAEQAEQFGVPASAVVTGTRIQRGELRALEEGAEQGTVVPISRSSRGSSGTDAPRNGGPKTGGRQRQ